MDILFLLIPIALVFVALAIRLFLWAVRSGQYDDLEMESRRILFEESPQDDKSDNRVDVDNLHESNSLAETVRPDTAKSESGDP